MPLYGALIVMEDLRPEDGWQAAPGRTGQSVVSFEDAGFILEQIAKLQMESAAWAPRGAWEAPRCVE